MILPRRAGLLFFFFFNDTATTEIYTLSLHDALPISHASRDDLPEQGATPSRANRDEVRSEEHTSELQSQSNLVCRLLLEKKNRNDKHPNPGSRTRGFPRFHRLTGNFLRARWQAS